MSVQVGDASKAVSAECKALVDIAEPPDEMQDFTKNLQARPCIAVELQTLQPCLFSCCRIVCRCLQVGRLPLCHEQCLLCWRLNDAVL